MSERYSPPQPEQSGPPPVDVGAVRKRAAAEKGRRLFRRVRAIDAEGRQRHQEELQEIRDQIANL